MTAPAATAPLTLAEFAGDEFRTRRVFARRQIAAGRWSAGEAEARLLPWAAIALAAGADLPELAEPGTEIFPENGRPRACPRFPSDFAPRDEWRAELARACRDALTRDPALDGERAGRLVALAIHLGLTAAEIYPRDRAA